MLRNPQAPLWSLLGAAVKPTGATPESTGVALERTAGALEPTSIALAPRCAALVSTLRYTRFYFKVLPFPF